MNAKLTKAQETEQAFLLSVSHELKTPLTSIRGYAEGIGDGTVTPADGSAVIGAESSPPRAAGRRSARLGAHAQERLHRAPRGGGPDGAGATTSRAATKARRVTPA